MSLEMHPMSIAKLKRAATPACIKRYAGYGPKKIHKPRPVLGLLGPLQAEVLPSVPEPPRALPNSRSQKAGSATPTVKV